MVRANADYVIELLESDEPLDLLVVVHFSDYEKLSAWYKIVQPIVSSGRLDILLELHGPIGMKEPRELGRVFPWAIGAAYELSRPLHLDSDEKLQYLVAQSTVADRSAGLSPKIAMMGLSEVGVSLTTYTVQTAPPPKELYAVEVGNKFLHQVMKCIGKSGFDWVTRLSRAHGQARVVYHSMGLRDLKEMQEHVDRERGEGCLFQLLRGGLTRELFGGPCF